MKWYTQDNGVLCLGTQDSQYANFHFKTDVIVKIKINTQLSESHIDLIGSFPEDWRTEKHIQQRINNAAKHFFGLSELASSSAFA